MEGRGTHEGPTEVTQVSDLASQRLFIFLQRKLSENLEAGALDHTHTHTHTHTGGKVNQMPPWKDSDFWMQRRALNGHSAGGRKATGPANGPKGGFA